MISIIDYGAGNLHSVKNALDYLGADSAVTGSSDEVRRADKLILPGVGAFGSAMESLRNRGLDTAIKDAVSAGTPILGICLGLQLMFEASDESPGAEGLGIFNGRIVKIPDTGLKIPHMGWNNIKLKKKSRILPDDGAFMYFVHSYYLKTDDADIVSASTSYGAELDVAAERGSVFATQFHPEKSGAAGMRILKNFIEL